VKNIYQNGGESQLALKLRQRHPMYNLAYGSLMMQPLRGCICAAPHIFFCFVYHLPIRKSYSGIQSPTSAPAKIVLLCMISRVSYFVVLYILTIYIYS